LSRSRSQLGGARLYASGFRVHDDLRLPHSVAEQFTFHVPRQAYSDGRLDLRFVRVEPGDMAAVSEIWLMGSSQIVAHPL
jgi:hypothetical protein